MRRWVNNKLTGENNFSLRSQNLCSKYWRTLRGMHRFKLFLSVSKYNPQVPIVWHKLFFLTAAVMPVDERNSAQRNYSIIAGDKIHSPLCFVRVILMKTVQHIESNKQQRMCMKRTNRQDCNIFLDGDKNRVGKVPCAKTQAGYGVRGVAQQPQSNDSITSFALCVDPSISVEL